MPDHLVMHLFSRMIARFLPRIFGSDDDQFVSLQCSFRLFRLLLQYHDPELCKFLDQFELPPELYGTRKDGCGLRFWFVVCGVLGW